jgi:DNA polymerase zeta
MAELADAIVQCGRTTLEWTISRINRHPDWKAEVVYGDTDSVFVHLRGRSRQEAFAIGEQIAEYITKKSPADVVLKFEKVYLPCCLVSKKRYVGYAFESPQDLQPRFDAKGIEVVRRDQCLATCKLQEKALRILFETKDLSAVKAYLYEQWTKMHQGGTRLPLRDFIFRKEVRLGKYAKHTDSDDPKSLPPGAVVACKRMAKDPRAEPPYRWRVPYVVVSGPPQALLRDLVVSPEEVLMRSGRETGGRSSTDSMRINHIYYITKHILPALERVLNFSGIDVGAWYRQMPKPSASWRDSHCLDPAVVSDVLDLEVAAENGLRSNRTWRGGRVQPTITQFLRAGCCAACGSCIDGGTRRNKTTPFLVGGRNQALQITQRLRDLSANALCETCLASPAGVLMFLFSRRQSVESRQQALKTLCQACAGHDQIEDLFLTGITAHGAAAAGGNSAPCAPVLIGADCCVSTDCPVFHERRRQISKVEDIKVLTVITAAGTSPISS